MLLSEIPAWFAKRFGADATGTYIRPIPATTGDPAAASMSLGFPPQTFTDESAGGTPPDGRDMNGILNYLSAWAQWQGAGGPVPWNSTTAAAGYPLGAVIASNTIAGALYCSTADGNTTNPDADGAGWVRVANRAALAADLVAATDAFLAATPKALADAGFRYVVASSLTTNGYREYSDGFKECWGRVVVPANSTVTVTMPITHTGFIQPVIGASLTNAANEPNRIGVQPPGLNTFVLQNTGSVDQTVNWQTVGV